MLIGHSSCCLSFPMKGQMRLAMYTCGVRIKTMLHFEGREASQDQMSVVTGGTEVTHFYLPVCPDVCQILSISELLIDQSPFGHQPDTDYG